MPPQQGQAVRCDKAGTSSAHSWGHEQISTTLNRYTHDARDYADLRVRAAFAGLAADDLLTSGES
jgi:hypothetical protein